MARPKGAKNNPTEKLLTDALRVVALEEVKGKRKIRWIAEKIGERALAGEQWACQLMGDRLEGKPVQSMEMEHTGEVFHKIERQIVHPKDSDS